MLSVKDFTAKYEKYSDEELFEVNSTSENYSPEAKEALAIILVKKGGLEKIEKNLADKKVINDEVARIKRETDNLRRQMPNL